MRVSLDYILEGEDINTDDMDYSTQAKEYVREAKDIDRESAENIIKSTDYVKEDEYIGDESVEDNAEGKVFLSVKNNKKHSEK